MRRPRRADRPYARDFEIGQLSLLVFGPGRGEAQVLILPDGTVGVIDGCREPRDGDPTGRGDPVREFLADWHHLHGARTGGRLRFVALTHPHDDHYAGLGRLISAYAGNIDEVWCTFPTGGHYAKAYLAYEQLRRDNPDEVPGVEDCVGLTRIYAALDDLGGAELQVMQRGALAMTLLKRKVTGRQLRIDCIAPSGADLTFAQQDLCRVLSDTESDTPLRPRHDPNLTSAALLISWGESQLLLGGDLLCGQGRYQGWSRASPGVEGPVQVVKAAHHASEEAQDWELWHRIEPQLAIVTPFKEAAASYPPRPDVLRRLAALTTLALTSPPFWVHDGELLRPSRPIPPPTNLGRNAALAVTATAPARDDAVAVSLDPDGAITRLLLTGRADLYS